LHELVPKAETVALLVDPGQLRAEADLRELDKGGQALGQKVLVFKARNEREIDAPRLRLGYQALQASMCSSVSAWHP
jgi:hypothetical protein